MGLFGKKNSAAQAPSDGTTQINDDFSALLKQVQAGDAPGWGELWKRVYQLDKWYFIPSGSVDEQMRDGKPMPPRIGVIEERPMVYAYTSSDRALQAAVHNGIAKVGEGFALLSMDREGAARYVCSLPDEVWGVVFNVNVGESGFYAPMDNIAAMYEYYLDEVLPGSFDRYIRAVVAANQPQTYRRLTRQLCRLPEWFFIGEAVLYEDKPHMLVFTDPGHAAKGIAALGKTMEEVSPTRMPPLDAVRELKKWGEKTGGDAALINHGSQPIITSFEEFEGCMKAIGLMPKD